MTAATTQPVLLLVPGMLNDERVWAGVAQALADVAQVRVARVTTQATIPAMAQDAWALLADLPPEAPVVLVGFSMGGYVAIEMLARPQRRLRAAALVATTARPESPQGQAQREKSIAALQGDFARTVQGIAQWGSHEPTPALLQALTAMMLDVGAETAVRQTRAIMARGDHREALARLDLPVHVLCGAADRITPPALSQELAALIPHARFHEIEKAGHMLPLEQPQPVAALLRPLCELPQGALA
ncbi:alpha/beta fold hydrolase [Hydrogenophaga sp.]|jgi:pimeloyl-ACP methyl ester carboxylesterase|uniref:alpha/beta fold hydrolase n=1 Tax=Hydrogenophaga sp. TaxID=1904254 RepID=UPI00391A29C7